ncbi:MAG: hypothetical protein B7Z75_14185 [Acidocella sp. 20-57-95]|nr:MAG: hypothetical protein B7Z75_14185 [Acidocella sp. 20-57-95]
MNETYMGFYGRDELLAALNELLEAERAGARVALRTMAECTDERLIAQMQTLHRDEARWCGMLINAILQLHGLPSKRTGMFYEKAMAIEALPERLAFLIVGQKWVTRKLQGLLPNVRNESLHVSLTAMLVAHERAIVTAQQEVGL